MTVIVTLCVMLGCFTDAAVNMADPVALGVNVNEAPVAGVLGQAAPEQVQVTPLLLESFATVAEMVTDWPASIPSEAGETATLIEAPPPQPAKTTASTSNDAAAKYRDARTMNAPLLKRRSPRHTPAHPSRVAR
ncbi:MAG: hypothetical protein KGL02_02150 [Acidobacteriota bacterium]|nr:hypothetical protein [Acidobacteriota bacterium]